MSNGRSTVGALHKRRDSLSLLRQFLRAPAVIGAVAPSSRVLAECMVKDVDLKHAEAVLEFGPGTGSFTNHILERLPSGCRFLAIELDQVMADIWSRRYPGQKLCVDRVEEVASICDAEGIERVDAVFSGLPWATFDHDAQRRTLEGTVSVLKPGGRFVTFGYWFGTLMPRGKRFYELLPRYFSEVTYSRYVWRNLPPAFVVQCRK